MKKILVILAVCAVVLAIIFIVVNSSKDKKNELIMATEAGFAPYEFYEGQDIVGVDVKTAQDGQGKNNRARNPKRFV